VPDAWLEWFGERDATLVRSSLGISVGVFVLLMLYRDGLPEDVSRSVHEEARKESIPKVLATLLRDGIRIRDEKAELLQEREEQSTLARLERIKLEREASDEEAKSRHDAAVRRQREVRLLQAMTTDEFNLVLGEMSRSLISWSGSMRFMTQDQQHAYLREHRDLVTSEFIPAGLLEAVEKRLATSDKAQA